MAKIGYMSPTIIVTTTFSLSRGGVFVIYDKLERKYFWVNAQ
jgi:hypothetical protein